MKVAIPEWLVTHTRLECSYTVSDDEENRILFAFSSRGKGNEFCRAIAEEGLSPYRMDGTEDLRRSLNTADTHSERWLVAIDAKGLADTSYQVIKLADLIDTIEGNEKEIKCVDYRPRKQQGN